MRDGGARGVNPGLRAAALRAFEAGFVCDLWEESDTSFVTASAREAIENLALEVVGFAFGFPARPGFPLAAGHFGSLRHGFGSLIKRPSSSILAVFQS